MKNQKENFGKPRKRTDQTNRTDQTDWNRTDRTDQNQTDQTDQNQTDRNRTRLEGHPRSKGFPSWIMDHGSWIKYQGSRILDLVLA